MKFYIETYGCTANFGNSQELMEALICSGHIYSPPEEADVIIVNTCAVTERTERKIRKRLRSIPGKRLIVSGCLPAALPESLQGIACLKQTGILDRSAVSEIAALLKDAKSGRKATSSAVIPPTCGIINIAEGCLGQCSYCIVKNARGKLKSRSIDEVVRRAESMALSGIAEIQLAAQDTAAYGLDIGTSLPELIDKVTAISGKFRVRVGMMNPDTARPILMELIEAFRDPKVYRFLHLPVQSGSNRVLENMRRKYTVEDFLGIVDAFRGQFQDISVITDVIVGFPGETDADFRQTTDLIESLQPDKVNVTRFSRRPGTAAARLYDMPDRIKKDRSRELTRLWQEIAEMRNIRLLGSTVAAQVTERGKWDAVMARTENYREIVVHRHLDLGGVHRFKIVKTCPFYLEGEIASRE